MSETCVGIKLEKIRATVDISGYEVYTPDVKSFNVDKSRGRIIATFSATLEVPVSANFVLGGDFKIYAGTKGNEKKIFTGIIKSISSNPSFDKPGYFILNLAGTDKMGIMEGKNFSRRLRADGFSMFCGITSGSGKPTRGLSLEKRMGGGHTHTFVSAKPRLESSEHTELIKMPNRMGDKSGPYGKIENVSQASDLAAANKNKTVHDHSTLTQQGPSFGTYSAE